MITLGSLWLAIVLSAVLVWIASALIWMVLPHHRSDFKALPDEEAAREALGSQSLAPGEYDIPHCASMKEMQQPESRRKFEQGPVGFITVLPNRPPPMSRNMALTAVFYLIVSTLVAYVASRSLAPGAEYSSVFRLTSVIAWLAYGFAVVPDAIWFGRPWSGVVKTLVDALAYALLTAGVFGWLWPG
ncbi:MAG: hypothetical protein OEM98_18780 [Gammaproteobacteria bacterium]|nr:hypothetical protein [Gammaproteobacteria bacterium]